MDVWMGVIARLGDARLSGILSAESRGGAVALSLVRVGACTDELRLMGVERDDVPSGVRRAGDGGGSLARNSSRA